MERYVELYSREEIARLQRKIRVWRTALWALSAAALALCVLFCLRTRTGNAARMEAYAVAVFTLCGWFVLYVRRFVIDSSRHALTHAETMLSGERTALTGAVTVSEETVRIKNSIAVRRVYLRQPDGEEKRLSVSEEKAEALRSLGREMTLHTVYNYVAACEVLDEGP